MRCDARGVGHGAGRNRRRVDERIVALDADVKNSTFSDDSQKAFADRFFENFIAEQIMVGIVDGARCPRRRDRSPRRLRAFLTRAARLHPHGGDLGREREAHGLHAGISIGEDGPSQMALEDLAMMRAVARTARCCIPARLSLPSAWLGPHGEHNGLGLHADVAAEDPGSSTIRRRMFLHRRLQGRAAERSGCCDDCRKRASRCSRR